MAKATQAKISSNIFRESFLRKHKLHPVTDVNKPTIFFGVYAKTVEKIMLIKAPVICVWIGSDCLQAIKYAKRFTPLFERKDAIHIALSDVCSKSLSLTPIELTHKIIPITPFDYKDFNLQPMGKKVYYYGLQTNRIVYNLDCFLYIKELLNSYNIEFLHMQNHNLSHKDMPKIYSQTYCNLRITMHDGLPNTVIEMALMGRHSLWNGTAPGCQKWNSFTDICNFILQYKKEKYPNPLIREQMLDFINISDDWKNI